MTAAEVSVSPPDDPTVTQRERSNGDRPSDRSDQSSRKEHDSAVQIARILKNVVAPVTVITALLYYYGWVRTNAVASFFEIDPSILGLTVSDYVLRSVPTIIPVAALAAGGVLVIQWIDERLWSSKLVLRNMSGVRVAVGVVGAVLLLAGAWDMRRFDVDPYQLGPFLILAGVYLRYTHGVLPATSSTTPEQRRPLPVVRMLPLVLLGVLALFAVTWRVADQRGTAQARTLAEDLDERASALLLSETDLALPGPVRTQPLRVGDGTRFRFRYHGLRLLLEANDRWFLISETWRPGTSTYIYVVAKSDSVRLDFEA